MVTPSTHGRRDRVTKNRTKPCTLMSARQFQPKWKDKYPWIEYNDTVNKMFCKLCKQQGKSGVWANSGTNNFRQKTITDHETSSDHINSVETAGRQQLTVVAGVSNAWENKQPDIHNALQVCYCVVMEELPDVKFKSVLTFLQHGENAPHDLSDMFYQLVKCLNDVVEDHLRDEIRQSPYIGIRLDEWTDHAGEKHLIINACYVSTTAEVKTAFLKCINGYDGQAVTIQKAVNDVAADYRIPVTRIVGLVTDCASVMANKLNIVSELMMEHNPHMVLVRCVCHCLDLAISQACKDIPSMAVLESTLATVYAFISMSPYRQEQVPDMVAMLNLKNVKAHCLCNVRWLSLDTIVTLLLNYEPFMKLVQKEAAIGDPMALGLNIQLSKYIYVALLHLVADILNTTSPDRDKVS